MLTRSEDPNPPREPFTCSDVEGWLKAAFRAMPFTPIYAPRGNTLRSAMQNQPSATFDILAFTGTVLGDRSEERKILLVWARAIVTEGQVGGSIAQFCEARGMHRSTFDRKRMRACKKIAAEKNKINQFVSNDQKIKISEVL
ncbi:hypothetical protein MKK84_24770 [Methylobacterium sp. E-065]|uniref:hypothetical protein n=1 Tax=Methylobacterium sp. E-065 TaxID=2836583 RepID=UPI001FB90DBF|nr:hypothetical protein [Methylobacterium sp. E-065]MCJ2020603.1 hypothetical protein [Methylobacterium sp. E-065]